MKIFVISDTHYGLNSAGFDRTPEIDDLVYRFVDAAAKAKADWVIHCGDLGQSNHPKAEIYGLWVRLWERLERDTAIKTRFLMGNHDILHRKGCQFGSFEPLAELNYEQVKPVVDISVEYLGENWHAVFLPYLSPSHHGPGLQAGAEKAIRVILDGIEESEGRAIVFSHWNVKGADIGGDRILRPSSMVFPEWICDHPAVSFAISGHIHHHQILKSQKANHFIVGSPIHTDFGDIGDKKYLEIELDGELAIVKPRETGAIRLVELNFDLVGQDLRLLRFDPAQVAEAMVKVSVRCSEDQRAAVDWEEFRAQIMEAGAYFVRPIRPVIVREKTHQPVKLRPGLQDNELVGAWLSERKPPGVKLVAKLAQETLENV